jgi:hypothetical protein
MAQRLDQFPSQTQILQTRSGLCPLHFLFHVKNLLLLPPARKNNGSLIIIIAQTAAKWEVFLSYFFLSSGLPDFSRKTPPQTGFPLTKRRICGYNGRVKT